MRRGDLFSIGPLKVAIPDIRTTVVEYRRREVASAQSHICYPHVLLVLLRYHPSVCTSFFFFPLSLHQFIFYLQLVFFVGG